MAKLTRQLHERISGDDTGNEDWWRLVFDTEAQRFYIEHEWRHTDAWRAARSNNGTAEFDIQRFPCGGGGADSQASCCGLSRPVQKGWPRMPRGPLEAPKARGPTSQSSSGTKDPNKAKPSLGAAAAPRGNARACFRFGSLTDLTARSRRVGFPKSRQLSVGINVCKVPKTAFPTRTGKQPRRGRWPGPPPSPCARSQRPKRHLPATHEEAYAPSSGV